MPSLPRPPWTLWFVATMTICATVYQYPHWHPPGDYQSMFPFVIIAIVGALTLGVLYGGRWAFVVNVLTVWIFPYETYVLGIKPLFRGSVLTAFHILALILLVISWRYFWTRPAKTLATEADAAQAL